MEKAVLKTLVYADIFDYPLKAWEIHKWLIGKSATLQQIEKTVGMLEKKNIIQSKGGIYFIKGRSSITRIRTSRESFSRKNLFWAKGVAFIFKIIPWVKMVGLSGSLAMNNAKYQDDIDFFIVTQRNRIWITRILLLGLLEVLGKRRKKRDSKREARGKFCINILLEESQLEQYNKDIYIAHEVLQMKPLWSRDNIYTRFLEDNNWVFNHLPNWATIEKSTQKPVKKKEKSAGFLPLDYLEGFLKWFQLKKMGIPKGDEQISDRSLFFHPQDNRKTILELYKTRLMKMKVR
jgi:hypothetical protein